MYPVCILGYTSLQYFFFNVKKREIGVNRTNRQMNKTKQQFVTCNVFLMRYMLYQNGTAKIYEMYKNENMKKFYAC